MEGGAGVGWDTQTHFMANLKGKVHLLHKSQHIPDHACQVLMAFKGSMLTFTFE